MKGFAKAVENLSTIVGIVLAVRLAIVAAILWLFWAIAMLVGHKWAIVILAMCSVMTIIQGLKEDD